jgi:hypothetical protein
MILIMPIDALAAEAVMPGAFLRLIAVAEVLCAAGLILPVLLRVLPGLTSMAATGLMVIMAGAVITSAMTAGGAAALAPLVIGGIAGFIAYGRWRLAPISARA